MVFAIGAFVVVVEVGHRWPNLLMIRTEHVVTAFAGE
jgi:hypothetical protein